MIHFDRVSKSFSSGVQALKTVSFTLDAGEMAFLTGHSGAGKTTLLRLIMCLEAPNGGQITVANHALHDLSTSQIPFLRRHIGIIFQNPYLLKKQTVFDNVALPLVIAGYAPHEIRRRVPAALDKIGLLSKEKYYPTELSSGEQQRVGIARAVVNKPRLLLADEPTGNLDPQLASEIMALFTQFSELGTSVLIASHDLVLIAKMHHRILTLHQGQLISDGTT